jgi:hypothetical protein
MGYITVRNRLTAGLAAIYGTDPFENIRRLSCPPGINTASSAKPGERQQAIEASIKCLDPADPVIREIDLRVFSFTEHRQLRPASCSELASCAGKFSK